VSLRFNQGLTVLSNYTGQMSPKLKAKGKLPEALLTKMVDTSAETEFGYSNGDALTTPLTKIESRSTVCGGSCDC